MHPFRVDILSPGAVLMDWTVRLLATFTSPFMVNWPTDGRIVLIISAAMMATWKIRFMESSAKVDRWNVVLECVSAANGAVTSTTRRASCLVFVCTEPRNWVLAEND